MKYTVEIELDENRTNCINCPLCNSEDYCVLQDEDDLFLNDGWDYQLSNCPLIKATAYDNAKEDLRLGKATRKAYIYGYAMTDEEMNALEIEELLQEFGE